MVAVLLLAAVAVEAPAVTAELSPQARVVWRQGEAPAVWVLPRSGEGWEQLARQWCAGTGLARALSQANPALSKPLLGVRVKVPWPLLAAQRQVAAAQALFPQDRRTVQGWEHVILAPWGEGESWWEMAEWFTGDGRNYVRLREANPQVPLFPQKGDRVLIPAPLLAEGFRRLAPQKEGSGAGIPPSPRPPAVSPSLSPTPRASTPPPAPASGKAAGPGATPVSLHPIQAAEKGTVPLEYREGEAIYRLAPGEALYSAVVVRFTGLLHAADVNATALKLAELSGIGDVTAIPVGFPIRIPFDLLLPEYLPPGHPRRKAWEAEREELAAIRRAIRAVNLEGVHVILDAGHGGADTGAVAGNVWEATYTYDVMTRLKRVLERETKATVWLVVKDLVLGDAPPDRDVLSPHRRQVLLSTPPYDLQDSATGVHLRWVKANALCRRLQKRGVSPEQVVFISIHGDSLHPAVRGLMVYVPSRRFRPLVARPPQYLPRCREVAEAGAFRFSKAYGARAEALSLQLAESLVQAARRFHLPVHPYDPVRSWVIRGGAHWVPAVLRFNSIPSAVLVEVVNLNNEEDRQLLLSWQFREKLAHALAAGLAEAFGR